MSYREAVRKPRCAICAEAAESSCLRCGRPLCAEHLPDVYRLCAPCERELRVANRPRTRSVTLWLGLLAIASASLLLLLLLAARSLSIAWLDRWLQPASWFIGLAVALTIARAHRRLLPALFARWRRRFVVGAPSDRYVSGGGVEDASAPRQEHAQ